MAVSTSKDDRLFGVLAGGLVALAWFALWLWGRSRYGWLLDHKGLAHLHLTDGVLLLGFVAGWVLMVSAMMLPTSLPLITLFRRLVSGRRERGRLVALLIAGYLAVWTLFGVLIHLADWGLHHVLDESLTPESGVRWLSVAPLLLAGLFQFTPLKHRCLDRCRSPFSFIVEHWRGRRAWAEALVLGVRHGLFCLGCCWALMLLMFAVGLGSLAWMLLLGIIMAVEKNVTWGRRLSAPLGAFLLVWAVILAAGLAAGPR